MRQRALFLLLPLAATACSTPTMVELGPSATPVERACAEQVNNGPAMSDARAVSAGRLSWEWMYLPQIEQAKRDAMTRCLQASGAVPKGGVERPR